MKLKTNLHKSAEIGPFRFCFCLNEKKIRKGSVDGTYLKISAIGRDEQWALVVPGNSHSFGYLLEALNQGKESQLLNYSRLMWSVSLLDTTDQELDNDLWRAVDNWSVRKQKQGAENAAKITETQEQADQVFMESVVERASMSKKEAKKASEADKAEMRAVLNEDKEAENGDTTDN